MKKTLFLLISVLFVFSLAYADITFVTLNWSATVGGCTGSTSSGTYNWPTGNFLVCDYSAAAADKVRIASGTDGSLTGAKLNTTGINLGGLGVFTICATKDGVIYGGTDIKSDGVTAGYSLIRWATQAAVPTQQDPDESLIAMQFPRAMDAIGSGASTVIGVTGDSTNYNVTFLTTTNGTTFAVTDQTPMASLNVTEQIKQGVALAPIMTKVYGTKADGAGEVCRMNKGAPDWAAAAGFTPPPSYTAPPTGLGAASPIGYAQGHNAIFVIGFNQTPDYLTVLNGDTGAIIQQISITQDVGNYGYGQIDLDEEAGVGYFIARSVTANSYVCGKFSFDPYVIPTNANVWNIYE